jgi:hypothetical protein
MGKAISEFGPRARRVVKCRQRTLSIGRAKTSPPEMRRSCGNPRKFTTASLHDFISAAYAESKWSRISFVKSVIYTTGPDGEIGRRSGLKIRRSNPPWGFKSPSGHQITPFHLPCKKESTDHARWWHRTMGPVWQSDRNQAAIG